MKDVTAKCLIAQNVWNTFAAMDAPELPEHPIDSVQVELARWQVNKFGYQSWERQVLGVIEEMGELEEAAVLCSLDMTQPYRDVVDAIGDIAVFSSQLLNANRLALSVALDMSAHVDYGKGLMSAAGQLSHVTLKRLQGIRGMADDFNFRVRLFESVVTVFAAVREYTEESDLAGILIKVAGEVMQRKGDMLPQQEG